MEDKFNTWGAVWTYIIVAFCAASGPSIAWGLNVYTHWEPNVQQNFIIAKKANDMNMAKLDSIYAYAKMLKNLSVPDSVKPSINGIIKTSGGKWRLISVAEQKLKDSIPSNESNFSFPLSKINNIEVKYIRDISFRVYWTVDRPSKGQIQYGTESGSYPFETKIENNTLIDHVQTVGSSANPLSANTDYYFRIYMEDEFGAKAYSQEYKQKTN